MEDNKWIGKSRALWSALLPILALVLDSFDVTNAESIGELASVLFNSGIGIASGILAFLHARNPVKTSIAK